MDKSTEKKSNLWKPLLHFFLLGFVVFGLMAWFGKPQTEAYDEQLIEITSADLSWFRNVFKKRMGRDPFAEELQNQVDQLVREQVLSREAARLGLDKKDDVVRRRLTQKMDYLFRDMASGVQPDELDLEAYLHAHTNRYILPALTSFDQVYFNAGTRGIQEAQQAAEAYVANPHGEGDATMLPQTMADASPAVIAGSFGVAFRDSILQADTGTWFTAVSSFGAHAVLIHNQTPALLPEVTDIRERLVEDWSAGKQAEVSAEAYKAVLRTYTVLLEGMPYDTGL